MPPATAEPHATPATVGERLLWLRKRHGLSQAALAKAATISREAVSKYERDESSPTVDTAARIAEALDVSIDFLVAGTPDDDGAIDGDILERARELAALPDAERRPLLTVLDSYLRDVRIRNAYR